MMVQKNPVLGNQLLGSDPRMIDVLGVLMGIDMQGFSRPEGSDEMPPGFNASSPSPASSPTAAPRSSPASSPTRRRFRRGTTRGTSSPTALRSTWRSRRRGTSSSMARGSRRVARTTRSIRRGRSWTCSTSIAMWRSRCICQARGTCSSSICRARGG